MAKKITVIEPKQEGDIDPYSTGKPMANPEPDNNKGNRPVVAEQQPSVPGLAQPHTIPNADITEQDEVAAERSEPGA